MFTREPFTAKTKAPGVNNKIIIKAQVNGKKAENNRKFVGQVTHYAAKRLQKNI